MDALLAAATPDEQRELLGVVFSTVWADHEGIKAITPTRVYLPLVGAISLGCFGVADGYQLPYPQPHDSFVILRMSRPLDGAGRAFAA